MIYASGSMGANKELEIEKGGLQKIMSTNLYLCDLEHSKKCDHHLEYLSKVDLKFSHSSSVNRGKDTISSR